MRIALVVPGGVSRDGEYRVIPSILWLIERLTRRHDVQVVTLRQESHPASWVLGGATVHNVGTRSWRRRAVHTLLRLHRSTPFDVFHALWVRGPGDVALAAGRLCRRPVLVHVAGGEFVWLPEIRYGGAGSAWSRWIAGTVVRWADRVTAASTPMLELVRSHGAEAERVALGVDTAFWTVIPPRPRPRDRPARLVHVGSLNPVKNQETLMHTAALLASTGLVFHLDVVGEDTMGGAVQRLADRLGIGARVTFHGFLPQHRLRPVVSAADLMVMSSRHEAGPVAVLEAAVAGVPTVGTAVGHLHELAPHGALVVDVGDAPALARTIGAVLDDDARRLQLARSAQQVAVRENADWTCARFEALYGESLAPRAR
jgi:glycosyltransferase involved in cell wall biosynthesis